MKLTEYENEEALDLLADILEPATEIFSDKKIREMMQEGKSRLKLIQYIIKEHKASIVALLARLDGVEVEEYHGNIVTMTKSLLDIVNDKEFMDFFTSQEPKKETI